MRFMAICLSLLTFFATAEAAYSQSASCKKFAARVASLSKDPSYLAASRYTKAAKKQSAQLRRTERKYVSGGCNKKAKAGKKLKGQCRTLASQIRSQRANLKSLTTKSKSGRKIARRREAALQQIARYNCNVKKKSKSSIKRTANKKDKPSNLLEAIFGKRSNRRATLEEVQAGFIDDQQSFQPNVHYGSTVRSLCVRTCDGYYWPVSFSTSKSHLQRDADICTAQCPNTEVQLYTHKNPGEDSENMISMTGASYKALPNAFLYRKKFDSSCTCKGAIDTGRIALTTSSQTNFTHAVISFATLDVPLPPKDPRRREKVITIAQADFVPLPRVRPGSEPVLAISSKIAVNDANQRFFKIDGKTIRLVGPKTPYVPVGAEES